MGTVCQLFEEWSHYNECRYFSLLILWIICCGRLKSTMTFFFPFTFVSLSQLHVLSFSCTVIKCLHKKRSFQHLNSYVNMLTVWNLLWIFVSWSKCVCLMFFFLIISIANEFELIFSIGCHKCFNIFLFIFFSHVQKDSQFLEKNVKWTIFILSCFILSWR